MNEQDREPTPSNGAGNTDDANPAPPQVPLIRWPINRGWWIVLAGAGVLMLTAYANSNIANYVFDRPDSGGASSALPAAIGTAASLLFLLPFRPLVGHFVDRRGPLVPVAAALLIGGFTYIVLAFIGPSWPSYSAAILIGSVMTVTARIALLTTVANLFSRHLGKAFAVVLVGVSTATLLPGILIEVILLTVGFVIDFDYRLIQFVIVALAGGILCIAGLAFLYAMRRWPVWDRQGWQRGTNILDAPTPAPGEGSDVDANVEPEPLQLREILTSRSYYLYVAAITLYGSILWPLFVFATNPWTNVVATLFSAILTIPCLLIIGVLSDRFDRKLVVIAILAILLIGTLPLTLGLGTLAGVVPVVLVAVGVTAGTPAVLALQWDYFGRKHFGLLFGIQASVTALVSTIWPVLSSVVFDFYGSPIFELLSVILPLAIALIFILLMKRPQPAVGSGVAEAQASEAQVA